MMHYGWPGMMNDWGGYGFLNWLPAIIFWIFLIIFSMAIVRGFGSDRMLGISGSKMPLDYLKERYAKGEITKKEFEDIKKDLG